MPRGLGATEMLPPDRVGRFRVTVSWEVTVQGAIEVEVRIPGFDPEDGTDLGESEANAELRQAAEQMVARSLRYHFPKGAPAVAFRHDAVASEVTGVVDWPADWTGEGMAVVLRRVVRVVPVER